MGKTYKKDLYFDGNDEAFVKEATKPKVKKVKVIPANDNCETCSGLGYVHGYDCPDCEGQGQ